jgi:hypothetical protein
MDCIEFVAEPRAIADLRIADGGIIDRHCVHRAPLAFEPNMTLPQPTAFLALVIRMRWRVSLLPEAFHRRRPTRSIRPTHAAGTAKLNGPP